MLYSLTQDSIVIVDPNINSVIATINFLLGTDIVVNQSNGDVYLVKNDYVKIFKYNSFLTYDYSLCQGVPNSSSGKLTLKAIRFKFADSKLNVSAPYKFTYTNNYAYQPAAKDRWDVYKPNAVGMGNTLFPFTEQSNATNEYAKAWSLSEINLPSGGVIKVDYESDDYAYVQDKKAMEMFVVNGFGINANYFGGNRLYIDENQP